MPLYEAHFGGFSLFIWVTDPNNEILKIPDNNTRTNCKAKTKRADF